MFPFVFVRVFKISSSFQQNLCPQQIKNKMEGIEIKEKEKKKKGLITKTWERCKSSSKAIGSLSSSSSSRRRRSISLPCIDATLLREEEDEEEEKRAKKGRVAPEGCFTVYVGPQKQRFVIKTEYANHPLFQMLLDEAESEYGYNSQGPLVLPCSVDIFDKVLMEMDKGSEETRQGCACAFGNRYGSHYYHLLSPSRMVALP